MIEWDHICWKLVCDVLNVKVCLELTNWVSKSCLQFKQSFAHSGELSEQVKREKSFFLSKFYSIQNSVLIEFLLQKLIKKMEIEWKWMKFG